MTRKQRLTRSLRHHQNRQASLRKSFFRPLSRGFERLEDRSLLATVTWDGGGGNFDWNTLDNWSTNALPVSGDDVIIPDLVGTPTITSGGTVGINSLTATEALAVTGGSFSVVEPPQLDGGVSVTGGIFLPNGLSSATSVTVASGATAGVTAVPTSGLVSLWHGEGTASDSANSNSGTLQGGTFFTAGKVGQAITFDSNDDRVTIAHSTNLNVQSPGFTAEFWMNGIKNQPDSIFEVLDKSHGFTDLTGWVFEGFSASGIMRFAMGSGSTFPGIESTVDLLDGNLHHVAGTWDGSTLRLYVDGLLQGSTGLGSVANNTRTLNMGYAWGGGTPIRFFRGTLDEVSIHARALSQTEIQASMAGGAYTQTAGTTTVGGTLTVDALQNSAGATVILSATGRISGASTFVNDGTLTISGQTFTGPAAFANTGTLNLQSGTTFITQSDLTNQGTLSIDATSKLQSALAGEESTWSAEDNASDSVDGNNGTLQNGATFATGRVGQAFSFDGVDDYVNVPDSNSLDFGTGDFSIAYWVKFNDLDDGSNGMVYKDTYEGDPADFIGFVFNINSGGGGVGFETRHRVSGSGPNTHARYATSNFQVDTWYHLGGVRQANVLKLYLDGVLVATTTESSPTDITTNTPLLIGALSSASPQNLRGNLDEVGIYNRALSATEISSLASADSITQTAGIINLDTGGTIHGGIEVQGGSLVGTGTVRGDVENSATVAPGNSPGIITVNGSYAQSSTGSLNIEIAGSNPATPDFDQLIVNGGVTLDGALNVSFLSGYAAPTGAAFRIIDNDLADAVSGTFSGLSEGATFSVGLTTFQISYIGGTGNDVVLTAASGPIVWDGGGDGVSWSSANNWSGNVLPIATDDVVIPDLSGTPTITSSDTVSIRSLVTAERLAITGGNFAVAQASQLNGGLTLSGGTLTANGVVTISGTSTWSGGGFAGTGSIVNTGSLGITATVSMGNTLFFNQGTVTQTGPTLNLNSSTIFNQASGVYILSGDVTLSNNTGTSRFDNVGTFRKSAGAGTSALSGSLTFMNLGGTIDVQAGTLTLRGGTSTGGTYTVVPGSLLNLTGGQTQTYTGTYTGSGGGTIQLDGGGADTGKIAAGAGGATLNFPAGLFKWKNGATLEGLTAPITNAGFITIDAAAGVGSVSLGNTLTNTGTITAIGGTIRLSSANINNQPGALFDLAADVSFASIAGTHAINNSGTFRKSTGSGISSVISQATFNNTGTVEVSAGTLSLATVTQSNATFLTGGTWIVDATVNSNSTLTFVNGSNFTTNFGHVILKGATSIFARINALNSNQGDFTLSGGRAFTTAGTLSNTGTVLIDAGSSLTIAGTTNSFSNNTNGTLVVHGTLTNANSAVGAVTSTSGGLVSGTGTIAANVLNGGTLLPGGANAFGILTITGNYNQASTGALYIEMEGTTAGTQYDRLAVTGTATLGGTLESRLLNGFTLTASNAFQVLTFGAVSGDFGTKKLEAAAGVYLNPSYGASSLTLTATAATPVTWTAVGGGNWTTASNWSTGLVPDITSAVTIPDLGGTPTITVNGTVTINSLVSSEKIAYTGGTFTINNGAAFNAGLDTSGALLDLHGNSSATGVNFTGGTRNGVERADLYLDREQHLDRRPTGEWQRGRRTVAEHGYTGHCRPGKRHSGQRQHPIQQCRDRHANRVRDPELERRTDHQRGCRRLGHSGAHRRLDGQRGGHGRGGEPGDYAADVRHRGV